MKSLKIFGIAAATASLLVFSAHAQSSNPATLKKGSTSQAVCNYTGLSVVNGSLTVDCVDDVQLLTGTPPSGGPYTLSVSPSPTSSGVIISSNSSCSPNSSGTCISGTAIASGNQVSITANPATGYTFGSWSAGPCSGQGATCIFTMANNYSFSANFTSTTTNTPPVVVPTGCDGLTPTTNYEARSSIGPAGQGSTHFGKAGVIYSYPLPRIRQGIFGTTTTPTTPGGMQVEVAISKCPGDMTYYQTAAAKYLQYGSLQAPCGMVGQPESVGTKWNNAIVNYDAYCIADTVPTQWYVNIRYSAGCEGGGSCPIVYFWQGQN
jgi:hypothetical protein